MTWLSVEAKWSNGEPPGPVAPWREPPERDEPSLSVLTRQDVVVFVRFRLLVVLLAVDAAFVLFHLLHHGGVEPFADETRWLLDADHGYPEWFGYGKLAVAAVLLVLLARQGPRLLYLAWALVVVVVLIDDAGTVHERVGGDIASTLDLNDGLGLRARDFGELAVWAAAGTVLLVLLVVVHIGVVARERRRSAGIFACLLLLGLFGVVGDMLHMVLSGKARQIAGGAEDGGELVAISFLLVYVTWLLTNDGRSSRERRKSPSPSTPVAAVTASG